GRFRPQATDFSGTFIHSGTAGTYGSGRLRTQPMIGAIEILIIAIIFGIIYGRDAIDKTFKKHVDEGVVESFAVDVKDFYKKDPKRLVLLVAGGLGGFIFIGLGIYWALTRTDLIKMIGLE
ncbi:MAG: hypothetical protein V3R23_02680, partial [Nitrospinaceae bacterium]